MYESAHTQAGEVRRALRRLEEAVARHEARLAGAETAASPPLQVLQRSVVMMRREADRLRALLGGH